VARFGPRAISDQPSSEVGGTRARDHSELDHIIEELERLVALRRTPRHSGRPLGAFLVTRGYLHRSELEYALRRQAESGGRLGEIVVELGLVSEHDVVDLLAEQLGMDVLDLRRTRFDLSTALRLSIHCERRLRAVPLRVRRGMVDVAVADPTVPNLIEELTLLLGAPVVLHLTANSVIDDLIERVEKG
jgi:MSHA biogenesis protein MshE